MLESVHATQAIEMEGGEGLITQGERDCAKKTVCPA